MKLHHIGKVVEDLAAAQQYYLETFGLKPTAEAVVDPIQKVKVIKLDTGHGDRLTIELIQPLSEDSPVFKFLSKGGGLHHLGYEVEDIRQAVTELKNKGAIMLGDVVPGRGHDDSPTAWLYTGSRELVELVGRK